VEVPLEVADEWGIHALQPPYSRIQTILALERVARAGVIPGQILILTPLRADPERCCAQLDALRAYLPWLSLVVIPPTGMPAHALPSFLTRMSRHGAVIVLPDIADPCLIVRAVVESFDPIVDLRAYLRTVVPRWPADSRNRACELFGEGLAYDPENLTHSNHLPRRHFLWMQLGRAMAAALRIQREPERSLRSLSAASTYADHKSMNRALERAFGVRGGEIRGTAGWEWLLWRFLSGARRGKGGGWGPKKGRE
jgi:hypothetical protein